MKGKNLLRIIMETNKDNYLGKPFCQNDSNPAGDNIYKSYVGD